MRRREKVPHLVLTRRPGELIVIDVPGYPPITIKVGYDNRMHQVKLRVGAHRDIGVHREEVYDAIQQASS